MTGTRAVLTSTDGPPSGLASSAGRCRSRSVSGVRDRLCDAAVAYCAAGWPVLPTRAPGFSQLVCGQGPATPEVAFQWWSEQVYGIGCSVGRLFDVVQAPASIGRRMLLKLAGPGLPVLQARIGHGHGVLVWRFLVRPGAPRIRDLPAACAVRVIGDGCWMSLPPTPAAGGSVLWVTPALGRASGTLLSDMASPEVVSLRGLPHSLHVQWAALHALTAITRRATKTDETALGVTLRREYDAGASIAELARRLVRSPKYVQRLLRDAGTELRPPATAHPHARAGNRGDLIVRRH